MDPDIRSPASPGTPLFPLSNDNANARKRPFPDSDMPLDAIHHQLSPSPALSTLPHLLQSKGHFRNSSDVQGKVAQFNGLAKEAAQRRRDGEAALKRAILGREEAEGESKRLRDGNEMLRKEMEEGRGRELKLLEKAEEFKELLRREKEAHGRERAIFEKEVKRSRKDAFKSSSMLVACQDELRHTRNKFTLMREDMESQKRLKEDQRAEVVQAQTQLASLGDELESLRQRLQVAETEKVALKMTLDSEAVARAASQGSIALPPMPEDDEFASPRKRRRDERESSKENTDPQATLDTEEQEELMALKEDLRVEKRLRTKAQEEAHFLKMECQFGVCSCRVAERKGERYILDDRFAQQISKMAPLQQISHPRGHSQPAGTEQAVPIDPALAASSDRQSSTSHPPSDRTASSSGTVVFSPNSGTFKPQHPSESNPYFSSIEPATAANPAPPTTTFPNPPSTPGQSSPPLPYPKSEASRPSSRQHLPLQTSSPLPHPPHPPRTVSHPSISTVTNTTTIATKPSSSSTIDENAIFSPAPNTPGGISREEALERIRARRGRARSFAVGIGGTPGRAGMMGGAGAGGAKPDGGEREEGAGGGRVISAPVGGTGSRMGK